jgi:hypothetical protein
MRLVVIVARVGASVEKAELFSTAFSEKGAERMAKINHWGADDSGGDVSSSGVGSA